MSKECVICRGAKFIRLPVYRQPSPLYEPAAPMMMQAEESSRTYPCPECNAQVAAEEKVSILYAESTVRDYGKGSPDMDREVAAELSNVLSRKFLSDNLIEIIKEKRGGDTLFIAKCAIVSPKVATRIERRAFSKMKEFLGSVAESAASSIAVWGSHYTGSEGMISKGQAIDYMRAAFRKHIEDTEVKGV